jgi:hypothetical protein
VGKGEEGVQKPAQMCRELCQPTDTSDGLTLTLATRYDRPSSAVLLTLHQCSTENYIQLAA